ncbi:MAG: 30S ribosomal protein S4 [Actinobacteria bacterium]|nr:30S ribosomal protein S4 [Actinomycetota bacterium]MCL6087299.1 30S ribosomal protein S4 [Actinomycetota bacterium]
MARIKDAVCKLCRREKEKLFLKGLRCYTDKCGVTKKPYVPGQKAKMRLVESEYYTQLREKQKAKRYYGVLEAQFLNYYRKATRKSGITGEVLLQLLETRLDNVLYLMGFATSRAQSRQIISHGHVQVNNKKVNIPSFQIKEGQEVKIAEKSKELIPVVEARDSAQSLSIPEWLEVDFKNLKGKVVRIPVRADIKAPVNEQMIVELYSK